MEIPAGFQLPPANLTTKGSGPGDDNYAGNITLLLYPQYCTVDTCDLTLSNFMYIPNLPGNAVVAAIFAIFIVGQLFLGIKHKTWGYMIAAILGLLLEVVGYISRILIHNNPFNGDAFLMGLVTLTIAPAFLTASIYLCLSRIVIVYGEDISLFKPRTYTIVFCTCDIISLVLQALGGGIASSADTKKSSDLGKNIMLAGLLFQVASLALFAVACADFCFRVIKHKANRNPRYTKITSTTLFKAFLVGLLIASITIVIRSIYRCVELWGGFNSELFTGHEATFMILEGGMIIIATFCLTALHPAICFQGVWHEANFGFRTKKFAAEKAKREGSNSPA